jgi:hypothetical protein
MPWETGAGEGKYRYHPGGDSSAEPKDAPSAINVTIVPDVNLPKVRYSTPLYSPSIYYTIHLLVAPNWGSKKRKIYMC